MPKPNRFFGYGIFRDSSILGSLLGRPADSFSGKPATLKGYCLGIQKLDNVTDKVLTKAGMQTSPRSILLKSFGPDFVTYVITSDKNRLVDGVIWQIDQDDQKLIDEWELVEFGWLKRTSATAVVRSGEELSVVTYALPSEQLITRTANGLVYNTWLGSPAIINEQAKKVRRDYLERMSSI